jgi:ribosomal protein S18 acetylase RimI-like enzyme
MQVRSALGEGTILVCPMQSSQADETSGLFQSVLSAVPYYNERAKAGERLKYTSARLREIISDDPGAVLIALIGMQVIGYCFNERDDELLWLSWFGVHLDFRNRGVGHRLLGAFEDRARSMCSHKIWCDTRTNNSESISVLLRQGFEPLCTARNHWYGQDFILWEKPIA